VNRIGDKPTLNGVRESAERGRKTVLVHSDINNMPLIVDDGGVEEVYTRRHIYECTKQLEC